MKLQAFRPSSCGKAPCFREDGNDQSLSVGVKGRPRSPLNSLRSRRSLELLSRRRLPGATSLLDSRRAFRPRNQSSQLIGLSIGMQGT